MLRRQKILREGLSLRDLTRLRSFVEQGVEISSSLRQQNKKPPMGAFYFVGGERGIRTLEGRLTLTPLAGERFQPLSHLSGLSNHWVISPAEPNYYLGIVGGKDRVRAYSSLSTDASASLALFSLWIRSYISSRWTAMSLGAFMPMRTWFPFTPNTVMVTSLPTITVSPARRVRISMTSYSCLAGLLPRLLLRPCLSINCCNSSRFYDLVPLYGGIWCRVTLFTAPWPSGQLLRHPARNRA